MTNTKKYIKKKSTAVSGPNAAGPGYRTRRGFKVKSSMFSGGGKTFKKSTKGGGFNPSMFKTQHKG